VFIVATDLFKEMLDTPNVKCWGSECTAPTAKAFILRDYGTSRSL